MRIRHRRIQDRFLLHRYWAFDPRRESNVLATNSVHSFDRESFSSVAGHLRFSLTLSLAFRCVGGPDDRVVVWSAWGSVAVLCLVSFGPSQRFNLLSADTASVSHRFTGTLHLFFVVWDVTDERFVCRSSCRAGRRRWQTDFRLALAVRQDQLERRFRGKSHRRHFPTHHCSLSLTVILAMNQFEELIGGSATRAFETHHKTLTHSLTTIDPSQSGPSTSFFSPLSP